MKTDPSNEHREQAPERLFVQIFGDTPMRTVSVNAYRTDPREVHDSGKPVYEYVLASSRDQEIKEVLEGLATYINPPCWCPPETEHLPPSKPCLAARELWERVRG